MYYSMSEYKLVGYRRSKRAGKKYDAILRRVGQTVKFVHVPFGDLNYQHYKDSTPNKLYTRLDHGDRQRRDRYRTRHKKDLRDGFYSPGYFSYYKLW